MRRTSASAASGAQKSAKLSIAGKRRWATMAPEERAARHDYFAEMWNVPGNRGRQSDAMKANWQAYRDWERYDELYQRMRAAAQQSWDGR
jgi:hypothetical protein